MAKVVQSDPPVEKEVLAEAIVNISKGMTGLLKSGLNKRAITLLIQDHTGLNRGAITAVLDALPQLEKMYCK